ncbi:amidohydrolase family protein [Pseudonocardia broussonetiae]|uniref:Amidohydrolase family protein n=1 Tax=Pseudonocardia broussonetiae TaxID=2736640 RepID=A0A6M6JQ74_9PSEU|nr:amidohydrolase family protein [Pseudonocardia broussonetiae]
MGIPLSARPEARGGSGPPGSDPDTVRAHVLDGPGAGHAILNCLYAVQALHNADWSTALAGALNDWQAACWLAADRRFRASVVVSPHDPHAAADEVERCAATSGFVQVLLLGSSQAPLGQRLHWPIYAPPRRPGCRWRSTPGSPGPTRSHRWVGRRTTSRTTRARH